MGDKKNITEKLLKIVKQRKTPIVVEKQEIGYKLSRSTGGGLVSEGYSYSSDE
jgi:hypothetical protein